MADGVEPTQNDIDVARYGLLTQFVGLCHNSSYIAEIGDTGFSDFIENTARVIACERAYNRMLQNSLHEKDFNKVVDDKGK